MQLFGRIIAAFGKLYASFDRRWIAVSVVAAILLLTGLGCGLLGPASTPVSTPAVTATSRATRAPVPTPSPVPTDSMPPTPSAPVDKGRVQVGETVQGTLLPLGTDVWSLDARQGQVLSIYMHAANADVLDTYLELYDEAGALLAEDDDGGGGTNAAILEFPVPVTGTYAIHALPYAGAGSYALRVERVDVGGALAYGEMAAGWIPAPWSRHPWTLDGEQDQVVSIAMYAVDETLDCYLELYGPGDRLLTGDDDSGPGFDALIETYTLPVSGTYRVVARGAEFGPTGEYTLTVDLVDLVVQGMLVYSDTVEANLRPGTRHHWLFEGEEGDVVRITMLGQEMDTYLELFAPDGVRVAVDDDGGGGTDAAILDFELPLSGT